MSELDTIARELAGPGGLLYRLLHQTKFLLERRIGSPERYETARKAIEHLTDAVAAEIQVPDSSLGSWIRISRLYTDAFGDNDLFDFPSADADVFIDPNLPDQDEESVAEMVEINQELQNLRRRFLTVATRSQCEDTLRELKQLYIHFNNRFFACCYPNKPVGTKTLDEEEFTEDYANRHRRNDFLIWLQRRETNDVAAVFFGEGAHHRAPTDWPTSLPAIMDRLHDLKQRLAHDIPTGQGNTFLTVVGILNGLESGTHQKTGEMNQLIDRATSIVSSYCEDAAMRSRPEVDAEILKYGRDIAEVTEQVSLIEREGNFITKTWLPPFKKHMRLLHDLKARLEAVQRERDDASVKLSAAEQAAREHAQQEHTKLETVALMRENMQEQIRKYPSQEEALRRSWRKAIEAVMEG